MKLDFAQNCHDTYELHIEINENLTLICIT